MQLLTLPQSLSQTLLIWLKMTPRFLNSSRMRDDRGELKKKVIGLIRNKIIDQK